MNSTLVSKVGEIADGVARPAAASVDLGARFPGEAFEALRGAGLLSATVPRSLGGLGCELREIAAMCRVLGRACASTAMIFAMHHIQVACLVRHGSSAPFFRDYLAGLCRSQWLVASGTSEIGTGGDLQTSIAGLELVGARFSVEKRCSVLSYGAEADAILLTARRARTAPAGDQVAVLLKKGDFDLQQVSGWDSMGLRGTRSAGFTVSAEAGVEQVLPDTFRAIASETMIPWSHIAWASTWLGLAEDSIRIARAAVRRHARLQPGALPRSAPALAQATADLQVLRVLVASAVETQASQLQRDSGEPALASSLARAVELNALKVSASQATVRICAAALEICGIEGYLNDGPCSVSRQLRDALGAPLMVGNARLLAANAGLLLVCPESSE